ncbi:hypothetical protein HY009_01180 [Candidatus Acetothermia bacterium]|nr:hypothetical protein [Candidatus Acetothermia bacterium]
MSITAIVIWFVLLLYYIRQRAFSSMRHTDPSSSAGIFAARTDVAGIVKQSIFYLDECFGLAKRRYIQIRENVTQMLLCHRLLAA